MSRLRLLRTLAILAILGGGLLVLYVSVGEYPLPPREVLQAVLGRGSERDQFVIYTLRLPRGLVALLVGGAMATAGAMLQGLLRNPLASPDTVGAAGGANLAAVGVMLLAPAAPPAAQAVAAFAGALAAMGLVQRLAGPRSAAPARLLLVGVGITALAQAAVGFLLLLSPIYYVSEAMIWLSGSVYGRNAEQLRPLVASLVLLGPAAWLLSRHLDALQLGEDVARGLGVAVERQRSRILLVAAALTGVAVASAGAVGFVGLIAPHAARRLVGNRHAGLLPTAAAGGGLTVLVADLLGRTLAAPAEIPCGVLTAAVGAPYFVYLLLKVRTV
ncbi:MAG TPA: iron ABC transporter permease [Bacillota bacterium]